MHHELALALALFWMLRSQGASLGAPERASECNARQTLEKCETFPPIFKLSSRQIIPLQCESWFVVQIPVHHVLVRPQDLFCTPRFPSWHKISIFHVSLRKRSAEVRTGCRPAARVERVQAPSARSKHHESTLGDPPEARGRPPSVALSSTLSDFSKNNNNLNSTPSAPKVWSS